MNSLTLSIVLFSPLVFYNDNHDNSSRIMSFIGKVIALSLLVLAFIFFSSSATLVMMTFFGVLSMRIMTQSSATIRLGLPIAAVGFLVVAYGPLIDFVEVNLNADSYSRGSRLMQYQYASQFISYNLLSGVGYFEVERLPVHNFPLFSWATSGYLAFIITILFYILLLRFGMETMRIAKGSNVVVIPLLAIVAVRTLFGGAGGVPVEASVVAIAIVVGLLERQFRGTTVLGRVQSRRIHPVWS